MPCILVYLDGYIVDYENLQSCRVRLRYCGLLQRAILMSQIVIFWVTISCNLVESDYETPGYDNVQSCRVRL